MEIKNGVMIVTDDDLAKSFKSRYPKGFHQEDIGFLALSHEAGTAALKCFLVVHLTGERGWIIKFNSGVAKRVMERSELMKWFNGEYERS